MFGPNTPGIPSYGAVLHPTGGPQGCELGSLLAKLNGMMKDSRRGPASGGLFGPQDQTRLSQE